MTSRTFVSSASKSDIDRALDYLEQSTTDPAWERHLLQRAREETKGWLPLEALPLGCAVAVLGFAVILLVPGAFATVPGLQPLVKRIMTAPGSQALHVCCAVVLLLISGFFAHVALSGLGRELREYRRVRALTHADPPTRHHTVRDLCDRFYGSTFKTAFQNSSELPEQVMAEVGLPYQVMEHAADNWEDLTRMWKAAWGPLPRHYKVDPAFGMGYHRDCRAEVLSAHTRARRDRRIVDLTTRIRVREYPDYLQLRLTPNAQPTVLAQVTFRTVVLDLPQGWFLVSLEPGTWVEGEA